MTLSSDEDSGLSIATAHPDSDMESAVCSEAIMYAGRERRTDGFRLGVWERRFVVGLWLFWFWSMLSSAFVEHESPFCFVLLSIRGSSKAGS